ncbi:TPA: hypothetical protein ACH3X1_007329 [Trebouxia sp. C0004]
MARIWTAEAAKGTYDAVRPKQEQLTLVDLPGAPRLIAPAAAVASTGLSGQQSWALAFSNAEAELPGHQSWSPGLSMPMDSRAQAQPSAGLTGVPLIVT